MKNDFFKRELKRRGEEVDNTSYEMLGAEIKRLRLKNRQTLSNVAENLCSISYVCKIERAQIKPNKHMLGEIYKRLEAKDEDMNRLFNLKDYIVKSVEWFYTNNTKKFIETDDEIKGLDNYRTMLFKFIYSIYNKDLVTASKLLNEIYKIANILTNAELYIFMFFASLMSYYNEDYVFVVENLKLIESLDENNILGILSYFYVFKAYFKMNNPLCLVYGEKLSDYFFKTLQYEQGEEIKYYISLYKLWNDMGQSLGKEIGMLKNKKYRVSLDFYSKIIQQKYRVKDFVNKKQYLTPFAELLFLYLTKSKDYFNKYIELDNNKEFELEYSHNIAYYLSLNDVDEQLNEIIKFIIPNIVLTKNNLEKKFFMDATYKSVIQTGKYKLFLTIYEKLRGI